MGENPMGFDGIRWVFGSALLLVHYCLGVQEANQTNLVAFVIVLYRLHVSCALASCISAAPNPEVDVSGRKETLPTGPVQIAKRLASFIALGTNFGTRRICSPSLSTARGVFFSKSRVVFWAWKFIRPG